MKPVNKEYFRDEVDVVSTPQVVLIQRCTSTVSLAQLWGCWLGEEGEGCKDIRDVSETVITAGQTEMDCLHSPEVTYGGDPTTGS